MEFLHHPWIFDHEQVKTEDDGLVDVDFRSERVKTMIKTVWSEFQEKNKVRIQFLCIVLDSTFDKPDDYLRKVMGVGDDIHDLIAQRGEVFLAPIAVRSPGGFSARGYDFRLDYSKICHPITTKIADDVWFCYHVTEFKNVIGIIKEGLRPGGHRGGRTQVFLNPFVPWDKRYREILGGTIDTPRTTSHGPCIQRSSTHESWSHDQRVWPNGGEWKHSLLRGDRCMVSEQQL